jgi:signal transduction histidine kinase
VRARKRIEESEQELQQRVRARTAELESQKNLLNSILTNSSNGISVTEMIKDASGNVIDATTILANDAAVRFTGLPKDIYLSKRATDLDPDIFSKPYGKTCVQTLATGEPAFIQYFLEVTGRWLELTISKMDDNHLIHIFTDVTPIKESQLQLEKTVEELRRSNRNLEEFAHAASHDLKEPIRKVHLFSNMLKQSFPSLDGEQQRLFDALKMPRSACAC